MSLRLEERDYALDGSGGVAAAEDDGAALLNEVLFRLTARRESFPFLPELGSRLHRLRQERPSAWETLAVQYAAEALADLQDVTVTGARVSRIEDGLSAAVDLLWQGGTLTVTAQVEG